MRGLNPAPTSMYLLKKVIQLREHSHPDHEKPFLEHLEDLRTMITRVVITLVISMIVCFAFNKELMEFFRRPVDQVLITQLKATLPDRRPPPADGGNLGKGPQSRTRGDEPGAGTARDFLSDHWATTTSCSTRNRSACCAPPSSCRRKNARHSSTRSTETDEFKLQVKALLKTKPSTDSDSQGNLKMMSALKPTEGFMLSMKLSFVAGIVLSFPLLLLFILQFVLPGLHSHEKRVMWPAMAVGFGLFLSGTAFAYYWVLPRALLFFYQWSGDMGISNDWRIGEYISFATQFTLLFGAVLRAAGGGDGVRETGPAQL